MAALATQSGCLVAASLASRPIQCSAVTVRLILPELVLAAVGEAEERPHVPRPAGELALPRVPSALPRQTQSAVPSLQHHSTVQWAQRCS